METITSIGVDVETLRKVHYELVAIEQLCTAIKAGVGYFNEPDLIETANTIKSKLSDIDRLLPSDFSHLPF